MDDRNTEVGWKWTAARSETGPADARSEKEADGAGTYSTCLTVQERTAHVMSCTVLAVVNSMTQQQDTAGVRNSGPRRSKHFLTNDAYSSSGIVWQQALEPHNPDIIVSTLSREWIGQGWLLVLLAVSWTFMYIFSVSQFAPDNLVSRNGFGRPVQRQSTHQSGAYPRDSSRFPVRHPYNIPSTVIGSVL